MRGYLATTALAVTLLLAGCDNDSPPDTAKAKAPAVSAAAPEAPKPPAANEPQGSAADLRAYRLDPLPAKVFVLPAPPPKKQDLAKNSQLKKPVAKAPPPTSHPLDLSIPSDADTPQAPKTRPAASRQAENSVAEAGLLPQLFRKEDNRGRFELGGRVISRDRSDDFEGAEVELRFRR